MPTLQFGAVTRTPVARGLTLRLLPPLVFQPVRRAPRVPGLVLLNEIEEPMHVEVAYGADPFTVVADIDLTEPRAWDLQDAISDTGASSLTLPTNDEMVPIIDIDTDDVLLRYYYAGLLLFTGLIETDDAVELTAPDDESGETITVTCRGAAALMDGGTIDPVGGPYRSPVQQDRHFGWSDKTYDHGSWEPVTIIGTVADIINVGAVLLVGFTDLLADQIAKMQEQVLRNIPTLDVPMAWAFGSAILDAPVGRSFFYEDETMNPDLVIAVAGDYVIHFICDDEGEFFVDGQQVGSVQGLNWVGNVSVAVTLSAGPHSIAAHVRNLPFGEVGSRNGASYGWVIARESAITTVLGTQDSVDIIATSSGSAVMLAYPDGVPGQTITKTIRIALEEIQARGKLLGISLDFTDDTFTDGTPAFAIPDVATKVGNSLLAFLGELKETYIDWRLDPATFRLQVWNKGSLGDDRTTGPAAVSFHEVLVPDDPDDPVTGGNLAYLTRKRERRKVDRLLLSWPGGWAVRSSGVANGTEQAMEVGAPANLDEVYRVGDGQLAEYSTARVQYDGTIVPFSSADAPGTGVKIGDKVLLRGSGERVMGWTIATNSETPEDPDITFTFRDRIFSPEERLAFDMRKVIG